VNKQRASYLHQGTFTEITCWYRNTGSFLVAKNTVEHKGKSCLYCLP